MRLASCLWEAKNEPGRLVYFPRIARGWKAATISLQPGLPGCSLQDQLQTKGYSDIHHCVFLIVHWLHDVLPLGQLFRAIEGEVP